MQQLPTLDQMQDILDIEDLIRFPWDRLFHWLLIFLLASLLVILAFLFYRWWQKRKNILNSDEHLLSHERLFLEVNRLRRQKLLERGEFRKYYFFLSETFRRYLWEQFQYPAPDKTTPEITPDLSGMFSAVPEGAKTASNFLKRADLVKFANYIPSLNEGNLDTDDLLALVRDVVHQIYFKTLSAEGGKAGGRGGGPPPRAEVSSTVGVTEGGTRHSDREGFEK